MNSDQEIIIPLRWKSSEHLSTTYVTHLRVLHTANEFYLVFAEIDPVAYVFDRSDPPEYLDVQPVVKIAVSPTQMRAFIAALQTNMEKYLETFTMSDEDAEQ